ncbi:DUF3737 family protein [Enterococcus larvae]|uniref:DUF3737 family protein n=1 Tax=Enterococcus larvae TaxID=2794352 RepID=UPI003F3C07C1
MEKFNQQLFTGERALFKANQLEISHSVFADGESPLKESANLKLDYDIFRWKYPLWYSNHITADQITFVDTARSGIWYTNDITITNSLIQAPKTFRRSSKITLVDVELPNAEETLWNCKEIRMENITVKGDYFGMNSEDIDIKNLTFSGNYAFDGARDVYVTDARIISKDAFWNCENVTIEDSTIVGEYFGWNSKSVTLINCTIESNQGFCYMKHLKMVDCILINTNLVFEYSTVDIKINSRVDSIKNPLLGLIEADEIKEMIFDDPEIQSENTVINLKKIKEVI